jgi:hypothetical protein
LQHPQNYNTQLTYSLLTTSSAPTKLAPTNQTIANIIQQYSKATKSTDTQVEVKTQTLQHSALLIESENHRETLFTGSGW